MCGGSGADRRPRGQGRPFTQPCAQDPSPHARACPGRAHIHTCARDPSPTRTRARDATRPRIRGTPPHARVHTGPLPDTDTHARVYAHTRV